MLGKTSRQTDKQTHTHTLTHTHQYTYVTRGRSEWITHPHAKSLQKLSHTLFVQMCTHRHPQARIHTLMLQGTKLELPTFIYHEPLKLELHSFIYHEPLKLELQSFIMSP